MADKARKTVDILVIHHSCGPDLKDKGILEVQDWFDECGKGWGYRNYCKEKGIDLLDFDTHHQHPRKDKMTYSQAQFALHEYKGKWRLVQLMDDPFGSVAWGVDRGGKWDVRCMHIEVCGNYHSKLLSEAALPVIVEAFIDHARNLQKLGIPWRVAGHCELGETECPGMIQGQIPTLNDMFARALMGATA